MPSRPSPATAAPPSASAAAAAVADAAASQPTPRADAVRRGRRRPRRPRAPSADADAARRPPTPTPVADADRRPPTRDADAEADLEPVRAAQAVPGQAELLDLHRSARATTCSASRNYFGVPLEHGQGAEPLDQDPGLRVGRADPDPAADPLSRGLAPRASAPLTDADVVGRARPTRPRGGRPTRTSALDRRGRALRTVRPSA